MSISTTESQLDFTQALLNWYDQFGRHDLPWQQQTSAYRVWVSEVMLQQTQVQTVIPYYQRFMARFPSVEDLAEASQESVLAHWSGLGYYARGRNLWKTAGIVVKDYQGHFPKTLEEVMALPGIGRSTAGAILAIANQQRHPILDGNVKRVLCRYDAIDRWSGEKATQEQLWRRADQLTPYDRVADYTQAIMDLGATLCRRANPLCEQCPVAENCQAWQKGVVSKYPVSKPKTIKPVRSAMVLLCCNEQGDVWLQQRPQSGIWGGLWSLPEFTGDRDLDQILSAVESPVLNPNNLIKWPEFKHTFTHYHLLIQPLVVTNALSVSLEGEWVSLPSALKRGLPAPIRKLIEKLGE
ncbi:A/G-specific adenine glycosylase [Hydrogenovibrio sp. SC-1]|uniref:A/G-specific adenine glycosylase n=1 Tax=Hydrogenovibrio sp. SC-1 TaxID=2065820 RepID=UPI000C7AC298|nr:A/G-specific adenine glycosylase [Hydrogenovibrio sp. SC-1]PLA75269.1 A/G-specific adenine glycosylase [Hydrogenovibrio sp. SC-1]